MLASAEMLAHQDINDFYEAHSDELNQLKQYVDISPPSELIKEIYKLHCRYIGDIEEAINRINHIYAGEFKFRRKKPFYDLIVNLDTYREEAAEYAALTGTCARSKKVIPPRGLKDLVIKASTQLIKQGENFEQTHNPKSIKNLISRVIEYLKEEGYKLTSKNEETIDDYFSKYKLQLKRTSEGRLIVAENSNKKKKIYNPEKKGL